MLIPRFWSEHRIRLREGRGPQTTIRRWGWSMQSQEEADRHAHERAEAVAEEVRSGRRLKLNQRRERKVAYNGAEGVPIREEILETVPDLAVVITRNAYGAHCLNVPDVLFADVDLEPTIRQQDTDGCLGCLSVLLVVLVLAGVGLVTWHRHLGLGVPAALLGLAMLPALWRWWWRARQRQRLYRPDWILRRCRAWCAAHPEWSLRVYRTPAGYRLLADHARFDPLDPQVARFFDFFKVDPRFAAMCRRQQCFRARLTGKPWRMQMERPQFHGAWPPAIEASAQKLQAWIARYEPAACGHAACRFLAQVGSQHVDPRAAEVRRLHDEASRALTELPLA